MYQLNRQWAQAKEAYEKALRFFQRMEDYTAVDKVMDKLRGVVRLESAFKATHGQADSSAAKDVVSRYEDAKRQEEQARAKEAQEKQAAEDTRRQPRTEEASEEMSTAAGQPSVAEQPQPEATPAEGKAEAAQLAEQPPTEQPSEQPVVAQEVAEERAEPPQPSLGAETGPEADLQQATPANQIDRAKAPPVFLKLAVLPVCEDRVAAGKPIISWGKITSYLTVTTLSIDDTEFYLREVFSGSGEPRIDSFYFAVLITGNSMEPTIHDGDCVLIRKTEPSQGDIVVMRVPDRSDEDQVTIKRFYLDKQHILLLPDNKEAEAIAIVEADTLVETVKGYYPELVERDRLRIIVGPESLVEGKVAAVLSPIPPSD